MMRQTYLGCADALTLGSRLRTSPGLPPAGVLRQRIAILLEEMTRRVQLAGASELDADDIRYAIVAFLDEQILGAQWPGRQEWMIEPLQFVYYNENTAGEGFFARLERIRQQPGRAHVLQIYHLCLTLGFQGKYAIRGQGETLDVLTQGLVRQVGASLPAIELISPRGEPPRRRSGSVRRNAPVLALGVGLVGLAVIAYVVLRIMIGDEASNTGRQVREALPATPSGPSGS